MECNAMIINETCRVNLPMKFSVSFGIVQLKAIGFHLSHRLIIIHSFMIPYNYIKLNSSTSIAYANSLDVPYIPSAKARGFTAYLVNAIVTPAIIKDITSYSVI